MARSDSAARQPHIAWRITRVFLHILGQIVLWALILAGTVAIIVVVAGTIFMTKFSDYLKQDIIPAAQEYANSLHLDNRDMAQTSIILYTDKTETLTSCSSFMPRRTVSGRITMKFLRT